MTTSSRSKRRQARYSSTDLDEALGLATALLCLGLVLTSAQPSSIRAFASAHSRQSQRSSNDQARTESNVTGPIKPATEAISPLVALRHFNDALKKHRDMAQAVRVMWLGDSHTAGVFWPAAFESVLLGKSVSGGPGYLPLGLGYGRYHGAHIASDEGFDVAPHPPARRTLEDDGVFGLGGTRVSPRDKPLGITVKLDPTLSSGDVECQLLFRYRQPNDHVAVMVSGKKLEGPNGAEVNLSQGVRVYSFKINARSVLEIRTVSGNPELFGLVVEDEHPGLVLDVLGINGARFATPLAWDEAAWKALVKWRQPTLVVIAYGTNEVFDLIAPERYRSDIQRLLDRIRAAVSDVDCILAGPTDVGRGGRVAEERANAIDRVEARAAEQLGCAYFSPYKAMGGATGFDEWLHSTPSLAVPDRIHLSAAGYRKLGEAMGHEVLGD